MRLQVPEREDWQEVADREIPLIRAFAHRVVALLGCIGIVLAVWAATTSPRIDAGQSGPGGPGFQVGDTTQPGPDESRTLDGELQIEEASG